jgi:hypothetical protein
MGGEAVRVNVHGRSPVSGMVSEITRSQSYHIITHWQHKTSQNVWMSICIGGATPAVNYGYGDRVFAKIFLLSRQIGR